MTADVLPTVRRNSAGDIVLVLPAGRALTLARILAHYDALMTWSPTELRRRLYEDPATPTAPALTGARGYEPEVWQKTLIDLLAEEARAVPPAHLVAVPRGGCCDG